MLSSTVIEPLATGTGVVRIHLDPVSEPFLHDHRVGTTALLSTVMGVEAMGCAAEQLCPGLLVASVSAVVNHPALLLPDDRPVDIEVEAVEVNDRVLTCRVTSGSGESAQLHYQALVGLCDRRAGPADSGLSWSWERDEASRAGAGAAGWAGAGAEDIYRLFFHGPAFRVVGQASVRGDTAVAWLAPHLPPLTRAGGASAVAPRLVELCLQASGLWELTSSGRMMIPRGIEGIRRSSDADSDTGLSLRAVTRRRPLPERSDPASSLGTEEDSVFDALVLDDRDRVHLEVSGYRTTAFDHPVDAGAVDAVVLALRG